MEREWSSVFLKWKSKPGGGERECRTHYVHRQCEVDLRTWPRQNGSEISSFRFPGPSVSASVCEVSPSKKEVGDRGKVPPGLPQVETSVSRWRNVAICGRLIEYCASGS